MSIKHLPAAGDQRGELSRRQAAEMLQLSAGGVDLLVRSGYAPDLRPARVVALAAAPFLGCSDGNQPVLRQGLMREADDDSGRKFIGESAQLTDAEVINADRQWWRCDAHALVAAGLLPVTLAGFVVTVLAHAKVDGARDVTLPPDPAKGRGRAVTHRRYSFAARLAGRVRALGEPDRDYVSPDLAPDEARAVRMLLGARSSAQSGGPVAYLPRG